MPARRCSICALDWPQTNEYKTCPSCEGKTDRVSNIDAMPADEAKSMKLNYEFERFYEKWDDEKPAARLIPEVAGSTQEGTELASIDRPEKPA